MIRRWTMKCLRWNVLNMSKLRCSLRGSWRMWSPLVTVRYEVTAKLKSKRRSDQT